MNWDDLRFVLALADAGSLARAARKLNVDHTTVGRRIEALEADLGIQLFTRTTNGYALMREAEDLLSGIRQVEVSVLAIERCAQGQDRALKGTVRITASEALGSRYLAPRIAAFTRRHPEITVDLMTNVQALDLSRREADVAIRLFRSRHDYLVVRRAGEFGYSLYASEEYLGRRALPTTVDELKKHDFVNLVLDAPVPNVATWVEELSCHGRVALRSNSTAVALGAALGGAGIALLPRFLGDGEPNLRRIRVPNEPTRAIWLTIHKDLRKAAPIRAVLDFLSEAFRADADFLRYGLSKD